jgi:hypothetical protein
MQLVNRPFALGGVSVFDGFPLPPLENMPGAPTAAARANASYYGQDMRWMIWHGSADPIFPVVRLSLIVNVVLIAARPGREGVAS